MSIGESKVVLVTGATGFLGEHTINELVYRGYDVIATGRDKNKLEQIRKLGIFTEYLDITDYNQCREVLSRYSIDVVVHAAALSTVWGKWEDFFYTNVIGTGNIAALCSTLGVKMIFISSPSIYASKDNKCLITENDVNESESLNYYIKSKKMAEDQIVKKVRYSFNGNKIMEYPKDFKWTIIRPRGIIGVGDKSIIPRLMKANRTIGIPLVGDGKHFVDVTAVENVVEAIILCIENDESDGEIFNITNDESMTFKDMVDMYFKMLGKKPRYMNISYEKLIKMAGVCEKTWKKLGIKGEPPLTVYTATTVGSSQTLDISKAKDILGYSPVITIKEALERYVNWYNI